VPRPACYREATVVNGATGIRGDLTLYLVFPKHSISVEGSIFLAASGTPMKDTNQLPESANAVVHRHSHWSQMSCIKGSLYKGP
jgi:hypothetical protein